MLPFGEEHLLELAVDLRMNGDRARGLNGAEPLKVNRNVAAKNGCDADRDRRRFGTRGARRRR
jgi:hypothetical protein